jgi:hypothetical protein
MALQLAIIGFWIWVDAQGEGPHRPDLAVLIGVTCAFVATVVPIAIIEGFREVRTIYLPALRRRLIGRRLAHIRQTEGESPRPLGVSRRARQLPK